jgi:N-methylhydantoinase A
MRTVLLPLDDSAWPGMRSLLEELSAEAAAAVEGMAGPGEITVVRAADLRYRGQSFELTVPLEPGTDAAGLARLFHAAHERNFGHAEEAAPVQVVSLRASASRPAPPIAMPREDAAPHAARPQGRTRLFIGGQWQEAALLDRSSLDPGAGFPGPAIVTQADSTILVPPGWRAEVDGWRNIVMHRDAREQG